MRRLALIAVVVVLAAGCGDDDGAADEGVVDRDRAVPADVQAFVDRIVDPATTPFTGDYDLLNKNGGAEYLIHVESDPPEVTVTINGEVVDLTDEPALSAFGIFSGFLAANPKAAIEATARRSDAGDAELTEVDGNDCLAIPVQGAAASTWCITPDGFIASVDNPSVRYSLVS